jgi:hypothetical protein
MKKSISKLLAIILSILFICQVGLVAFANDEPDWEDISLTQEEFDEVLNQNPNNQISTLTSGLISKAEIAVSKSSSNLIIAGRTVCSSDVVKCGFTVVTIQRRKDSSSSWSTYKTYEDLYKSSNSYTLSKTISVASGYQYRVTCTHYAKKSLLSTEKISNTSNNVTM